MTVATPYFQSKSSNMCLSEGVSLPAFRANDKPSIRNLQQSVRKNMDGEEISAAISFESCTDVGAVCIMSWFDGMPDIGTFSHPLCRLDLNTRVYAEIYHPSIIHLS
jgi:hypothetical protein